MLFPSKVKVNTRPVRTLHLSTASLIAIYLFPMEINRESMHPPADRCRWCCQVPEVEAFQTLGVLIDVDPASVARKVSDLWLQAGLLAWAARASLGWAVRTPLVLGLSWGCC